MQGKFIKTIRLQNEIRDREGYFYLGFCEETGQYMLSVTIGWVAVYERYYALDESDYLGYQLDREKFMLKYARELGNNRDCFTERFMGSAALRDYDGAEGFQNMLPADGNPFQGYYYADGVLYARMVWRNREVFVPPVRFLPDGKTDAERKPLRQNCRLLMNQDGESICFSLAE